jgi:hypothetical protein
VLREPASEADIRHAEQRLGVRLPPSYRAFLRVSNGAYASALGAELQYPFENQWRHGLLRVADIDLTARADPVGVDIWCERVPEHNDPDNDVVPTPGEPQMVGFYSPYRDGVLVTHIHNGTNRLALVPRRDLEEWELWDFRWEGASAHPSFADFLEWFVDRPDRRSRPEDADRLVTMFRANGTWTLGNLAELGDPRVVGLAREAIDAGKVDQRIPELLGRMGGSDSLRLLHSSTHAAGARFVSRPSWRWSTPAPATSTSSCATRSPTRTRTSGTGPSDDWRHDVTHGPEIALVRYVVVEATRRRRAGRRSFPARDQAARVRARGGTLRPASCQRPMASSMMPTMARAERDW